LSGVKKAQKMRVFGVRTPLLKGLIQCVRLRPSATRRTAAYTSRRHLCSSDESCRQCRFSRLWCVAPSNDSNQ